MTVKIDRHWLWQLGTTGVLCFPCTEIRGPYRTEMRNRRPGSKPIAEKCFLFFNLASVFGQVIE